MSFNPPHSCQEGQKKAYNKISYIDQYQFLYQTVKIFFCCEVLTWEFIWDWLSFGACL